MTRKKKRRCLRLCKKYARIALSIVCFLIIIRGTFVLVSCVHSRHSADAAVSSSGTASQKNIRIQVEKGVIPRIYQWDKTWSDYLYGDNTMELAGCGPTCLSMVIMGLTGEDTWHPVAVADFSAEHGYKTDHGTSWDLMTEGAKKLGLTSTELPLDENRIRRELEDGHPIICSMRPGDFTTTGHFIVLTGYQEDGFVLNDPNSRENSEKMWSYDVLKGQIKNLWAFSYGS